MTDKEKLDQTLHFVFFLVTLLTSKQISILVLIVFRGGYPRTITIQPIRQLQWTDTKAASENLIASFLENSKLQ